MWSARLFCMEFAWDVYAICMEYVWIAYGMCMGYVRNMHTISMNTYRYDRNMRHNVICTRNIY